MYKTKNENSGITLIALVITIIVLLILAGLTLTFVLGENGLFGKARKAQEETIKAQAIEEIQLKILEAQADDGNFTWEKFLTILDNSSDIYLVKKISSQTSSLSSGNGGITSTSGLNNHTGSVYVTNLTNYNYEVEIGSDSKVKNTVSSTSNSIDEDTETSRYNTNNQFKVKTVNYEGFSVSALDKAIKQFDIDEGYELVSATPVINGTTYFIVSIYQNEGHYEISFRNSDANETVTTTGVTLKILEKKIENN